MENHSHLIHVLQRLGSPRVLVLGDLMLDRYTWGDASRISPEAPVLVLKAGKRAVHLGGAANVAHMVCGLGARASVVGVVGDDEAGRQVRDGLRRAGVEDAAVLVDGSRPTTVKERFVAQVHSRNAHQILRVDSEATDPVAGELRDALCDQLVPMMREHDIVLVSDYGKGVCTPELLAPVMEAARDSGVRTIIDPAPIADYTRYRRGTLITPNRNESERATGIQIQEPADALRAARQLCDRFELEAAVVTLDRDGMALARGAAQAATFPTRARQVYDVTGAGDIVLATLGVCLAAGCDLEDAIRLANIAGGLEVERVGTSIVSRDEILADLLRYDRTAACKLVSVEELIPLVSARRRLGQTVVFTNGCFDLLHAGHVSYLQEAARLGHCLIVGVNSDRSVRLLKGESRPVVPEQQRARMLAALEAVDYVVVFAETTPENLLRLLQPDVLVKGGTYHPEEVVGREIVEAYGGRVEVTGLVPGTSTTQIVDQIVARSHVTVEQRPVTAHAGP